MIALLGAAGFIGSYVVGRLKGHQEPFIGLDLFTPRNRPDVHFADINDPLRLESIFIESGINTVLHLVGLPQIGLCEKNPHLSYRLNTQSVETTLEVMRKTDVPMITFASTAAIYPEHRKVYGCHKFLGEELIKTYSDSYGFDYCILRLCNVFGHNPSIGKDVLSVLIRRAKHEQELVINGANKFRDFIHVSDVATVFALSHHKLVNKTWDVGTGTKTTFRELAEMVAEAIPETEYRCVEDPDDDTGYVPSPEKIQNLTTALGRSLSDSKKSLKQHIRKYAK